MSIIVVSGLPRSGTSMMMNMLNDGGVPVLTDGVRQADEDNPRGYFELEAVKQTKQDATWLNNADGKAVKLVYTLLTELPPGHDYEVIFMRRDMKEILASQTRMLERTGHQGASVGADKLGEIFEGALRKAERWLSEQANMTVHYVHYKDVISAPLLAAEQLREFLGLPLDTDAMAAVVDASLYRQRA